MRTSDVIEKNVVGATRAKGLVGLGSVALAIFLLLFGVLLGGGSVGAGDANERVGTRELGEAGEPAAPSAGDHIGLTEGSSGFAASGARPAPKPAAGGDDGEAKGPPAAETAEVPEGPAAAGGGEVHRVEGVSREPPPGDEVARGEPSAPPAVTTPRGDGVPAAPAGGTAAGPAGPPADRTLYLTVPRLGLRGVPVLDENSEEAMAQGANHLPQTGFPWESGSNTYISGHRIGFPGTGSDRIFYELPALAEGDEVIVEDSEGARYEYRVSEAMEVAPEDVWVVEPVPGRDVLSLQTCIEDFGDPWSEGPDWEARYVVRADRV